MKGAKQKRWGIILVVFAYFLVIRPLKIEVSAFEQISDESSGITKTTYITPESFGAVGDGIVDDTKAFKELLEYTKYNDCTVLLTGNYAVDSINLPDGSRVISQGGIIRKIPRNETSYHLVTLNENCLIDGLVMTGDRESNSTDGQWGCCVYIAGKNSVIKNCTMFDPHGDGIYIHSDNAIVDNCIISNAFRNGISVTDGDNFTIRNTKIFNVNGHNPQCGIDIEPNNAVDSVSGQIIDVSIFDSCGGILIYKNAKQINAISVACRNVDIFGTRGKNAIRVRNDVYSFDEYSFDNIRILDSRPESDSVVEFTFSGDDNPAIYLSANIIGGENINGIAISSDTTRCSNPVSIKIISTGWSRIESASGNEFYIKMKNSNINICTNMEVKDEYQTAHILNFHDYCG